LTSLRQGSGWQAHLAERQPERLPYNVSAEKRTIKERGDFLYLVAEQLKKAFLVCGT
jgi:hypothetical protein